MHKYTYLECCLFFFYSLSTFFIITCLRHHSSPLLSNLTQSSRTHHLASARVFLSLYVAVSGNVISSSVSICDKADFFLSCFKKGP